MIVLKYLDNAKRETIAKIEIPANLSRKEVLVFLLDLYQNAGHERATEPQKLYVVNADSEWLPLSIVDHIDEDATIVYSGIVLPDSARRYATCEGIEYFFRTKENGHFDFPHIHAKECGEHDDFSIYLKDLRVVGRPRNPKVKRKAVEYVKRNRTAIGNEWNEIVGAQGEPKWEP